MNTQELVKAKASARAKAESIINPVIAANGHAVPPGMVLSIAVGGIWTEPRNSAERAVACEIGKGLQITTPGFRSFLHPRRIVLNELTDLAPVAC